MAQTNINIRMDENTKKDFDLFCKEIGLSVSSVFNLFAKTVVREQRIPFEITTEVPNADTIAAMKEIEQMKLHPERYKKYRTFADAIADIESEEEVNNIA